MMEINTARLRLRPLRKSDAADIVENVNDLEVSKWLAVVPYPYNRRDALSWIASNQKGWRKRKDKDSYSFGIALQEEDRIIGAIGLNSVDTYQGKGTVGYWIGQKYWGKGYGSEALEAVIDFAFGKLRLRRLEALVFAGNPSSGKLLEKYGFKQEGFKRKASRGKADGKIRDEYVYGLLKEDWQKIRKK